jgi:pimeloyl-ACP methyl ester carboxylesterase
MTRILYLHGFASSPSSRKARYFREHFERAGAHVDIPDLAAGDFEHLTITSQLAIVEQLANGQPLILMGSSMGGYLAALYAARHPEVERLILLAPAFRFAHRWEEYLGVPQVAEWQRTGTIEVFHYSENRKVQLGYQLLEDAANYEDYPDFHQPALVFHGALDDVVPATYSQQFAASHPNAHLEVLNSTHELLDVLAPMAVQIDLFLR